MSSKHSCTTAEARAFKTKNGILHGEVHTAQIFLPNYRHDRDRPSMATTYRTTSHEHTSERMGVVGTSFHFNPNKMTGACLSMNQYRDILGSVLLNLEFDGTYTLTRLDFKVDCNPPHELRNYWIKLTDLLGYAFMAYKKIEPKDRDRDIDPITGEHKHTKARSHGLEIVTYNKALQAPDEGVGYRTEFRAIRLNSKQGAAYCNEKAALERIKRNVAALPEYYADALSAQTARLVSEYKKTTPTSGRRSTGEFLRAHSCSIFNRYQIKQFALLIGGFDDKAASKFASNFVHRNQFIPLVEQSDLVKLCAVVIDMIDNYIGTRFTI